MRPSSDPRACCAASQRDRWAIVDSSRANHRSRRDRQCTVLVSQLGSRCRQTTLRSYIIERKPLPGAVTLGAQMARKCGRRPPISHLLGRSAVFEARSSAHEDCRSHFTRTLDSKRTLEGRRGDERRQQRHLSRDEIAPEAANADLHDDEDCGRDDPGQQSGEPDGLRRSVQPE